jgi:MOSC domain-containing protein YiiM
MGFCVWIKEQDMNRSSQRLNATGYLHRVLPEGGVAVADALAKLSNEDFENTLAAFRLYRADVRHESASEPRVLAL